MTERKSIQRIPERPEQGGHPRLLQRQCACGGPAGLTGECADCRKKKLARGALRTKLAINKPGDVYEREADRVADTVMRMSDADIGPAEGPIARLPAVGISRYPEAGTAEAPPIVHEVLGSPGQPLDAATRSFMEPRFGHDFSHVRVHTDAKAAESAKAVNALAYTVGKDVVFGAGAYQPRTNQGRSLMAHELAHTIQHAISVRRDGASLQRRVGGMSQCSRDISEDDCCEPGAIGRALDGIIKGLNINDIDGIMDIPFPVYVEGHYCCCVVVCQIVKPGQFSFEGRSEKYPCDCPLDINKQVPGIVGNEPVVFKVQKVDDLLCPLA